MPPWVGRRVYHHVYTPWVYREVYHPCIYTTLYHPGYTILYTAELRTVSAVQRGVQRGREEGLGSNREKGLGRGLSASQILRV